MKRRLAAILAADVVGFSRAMSQDEEGTITRIAALREDLIAATVAAHGGRVFKTMGDGVLAEFSSAVASVEAAEEIQNRLRAQNNRLPVALRMDMRIGVNLGDVVLDGDDLMGDGVNVAARLEGIAAPGGISISAALYEQIAGKLEITFDDAGFQSLKNIERPIHVYQRRQQTETAEPASKGGLFDFGNALASKPRATGGCLCGKVRYEAIEDPLGTGYCHCRMCQRFLGAPFSVWTAFKTEAIRFTRGKPKIFRSSPIAERGFCADCGSALTYCLHKPQDGGYLVVFTASLDHPEMQGPSSHGGMESMMPWLEINDALPRTRSDESWALRTAWASVGRPDPENWTTDIK